MESLGHPISFYAYALATMLTLLIGIVYATRKQIMPYHLKALETAWEDIDTKYQFMLRVFLNGAGAGALSTGLFMLVLLLIPFRDGQLWAGYAIGIVGLVSGLHLLYIVYSVRKNTKGNPPIRVVVLLNLALIIGLMFLVF